MKSQSLLNAALAATDPLKGPEAGALQVALRLLQAGTEPHGIINAMVERDECCFEATEQRSPAAIAAVENAVTLIPLLAAAGDKPSPEARASARYNCAPQVQKSLSDVCS